MSRATEERERARGPKRKARRRRAGGARYYVVEVEDGTGTVGKQHGPFAADEYEAEAGRIHAGGDDDTLLLLARVTKAGFSIENMSRNFLEGGDEAGDEE